MDEKKCIEYYFDSKQYNKKEILENIEKEKSEFPKQKFDVNITLNKYGIYIVRLECKNNKIAVIKRNRKTKQNKVTVYGKYKKTKTYAPI